MYTLGRKKQNLVSGRRQLVMKRRKGCLREERGDRGQNVGIRWEIIERDPRKQKNKLKGSNGKREQ